MRIRELASVLVAVACAVGIGRVQPSLAAGAMKAKHDDVAALPPPAQLRVMSLGYRTAAADLLWAKLVVEHGQRWQDKRGFPEMTAYMDGIIELVPDHPILYQFVDSLLLFTPVRATPEDARRARAYLERGTRERPYDPETWLHYGQYLAYLAPSFLKDLDEGERWRRDGALAILHAVELGAEADRSLAAASILNRLGEKKANISFLQHIYALSDDPETRRQIMFQLQRLDATPDAENTVSRVEHEWRTRYPFLPRSATLLMGPYRSAAGCAGPESYRLPSCPPDWSTDTGEGR
jgi:hypothetical protein